jgi:mediator of RNA polymerase II transcription subunit 7
LKELKEKISDGTELNLQHPLSLLVPPEPPKEHGYRSFGSLWQADDKLLSLAESNVPQLYGDLGGGEGSHQDRIWELKRLLKSLLVNFLELTGIMSTRPEEFPTKIEDIRIILINMHHLLNEYRPHQSRESLILTVQEQIQQKQTEVETVRRVCDTIRKRIQSLAEQVAQVDDNLDSTELQGYSALCGGDGDDKKRDLLSWRALDEI